MVSLLLFVLMSAKVRIEGHPKNGNGNAYDVPFIEGVVEQCIAKGQDETCLQMAQHLICHWRRLTDYKESAEVYRDCYQARKDDEYLSMDPKKKKCYGHTSHTDMLLLNNNIIKQR